MVFLIWAVVIKPNVRIIVFHLEPISDRRLTLCGLPSFIPDTAGWFPAPTAFSTVLPSLPCSPMVPEYCMRAERFAFPPLPVWLLSAHISANHFCKASLFFDSDISQGSSVSLPQTANQPPWAFSCQATSPSAVNLSIMIQSLGVTAGLVQVKRWQAALEMAGLLLSVCGLLLLIIISSSLLLI